MSWWQRGRARPHVFGWHIVYTATTASPGGWSVDPLLPAGLHLLVDIWTEVEKTFLCCIGQRRQEEGWMEHRIEKRWGRRNHYEKKMKEYIM